MIMVTFEEILKLDEAIQVLGALIQEDKIPDEASREAVNADHYLRSLTATLRELSQRLTNYKIAQTQKTATVPFEGQWTKFITEFYQVLEDEIRNSYGSQTPVKINSELSKVIKSLIDLRDALMEEDGKTKEQQQESVDSLIEKQREVNATNPDTVGFNA